MTAHRPPTGDRPARHAPLSGLTAAMTALVTGVVLGVAGLAGIAGPAHAAAYRYWNYYHLADGAWSSSQQGIEAYSPADGSVEGFRFAVSGESGSPRTPRAVVTFAAICGATPVAAGLKRVGVVLDFGRPADAREGGTPPAPTARCAVVDSAANTAKVLAAVAPIRAEKGFLCTIDGYPAGAACTDTLPAVPEAAAAPDAPIAISAGGSAVPTTAAPGTGADNPQATPVSNEPASSSGSSATWLAIILVVAAIAAAALLSLRRRRR